MCRLSEVKTNDATCAFHIAYPRDEVGSILKSDDMSPWMMQYQEDTPGWKISGVLPVHVVVMGFPDGAVDLKEEGLAIGLIPPPPSPHHIFRHHQPTFRGNIHHCPCTEFSPPPHHHHLATYIVVIIQVTISR
ncbi:hypothetical protein BaRGS_00009227 [Batillaria attramentaria]|uniref:Uncharacterized protein n=1 Tax=Batillaria attramentaria TaxID=370345 RepID=A0ABD0LJJ7_9CAEN